jgi:hypothetical protein
MQILLSNTKLTENISKQVISGDLAGDLSEVVEGLVDIPGLLS